MILQVQSIWVPQAKTENTAGNEEGLEWRVKKSDVCGGGESCKGDKEGMGRRFVEIKPRGKGMLCWMMLRVK